MTEKPKTKEMFDMRKRLLTCTTHTKSRNKTFTSRNSDVKVSWQIKEYGGLVIVDYFAQRYVDANLIQFVSVAMTFKSKLQMIQNVDMLGPVFPDKA